MQPTRPAILVVEDEQATRDLLTDVLQSAGYTVLTAADGIVAQKALRARNVELVLLDLMLPGMDGLELCQRVRAHEGDVYLPIIMLTALSDDPYRRAGFAAGADDYLTKPFKTDELLDRVHVWLRTRQRLKAAQQPRVSDAEVPEKARPRVEEQIALEEAVERHEPWVQYLLAEAADRPGFLAALLLPYARAQGWDEARLAAGLDTTHAGLVRLLLRPRPLPASWAADIAAMAEACEVEPRALAALLRAAEAWAAPLTR